MVGNQIIWMPLINSPSIWQIETMDLSHMAYKYLQTLDVQKSDLSGFQTPQKCLVDINLDHFLCAKWWRPNYFYALNRTRKFTVFGQIRGSDVRFSDICCKMNTTTIVLFKTNKKTSFALLIIFVETGVSLDVLWITRCFPHLAKTKKDLGPGLLRVEFDWTLSTRQFPPGIGQNFWSKN